jgi:hypothetical protein
MTATNRVLHLMLIDLKPEVDAAQRQRLIEGWKSLSSVSGVTSLGAVAGSVGGTHGLGLFALLDDLASTEVFGTDAHHMRFLRNHFIPALKGFAGADLFVGGPPPAGAASALCLLFNTADSVYDWQVHAAFDGLREEAQPVAVWAGTAINTRQRYQAGGVVFFESESGADAFATREQFQRIRAQHFDPISPEIALLWGAVSLVEM